MGDVLTAVEVPGFTGFPKIPRLSRECVVTEKIDGTNASVLVMEDGRVLAASRTRWITPAVAEALTEAILLDPAHGSATLTRERFHALMRVTHGLVVLRGKVWEVRVQRVDGEHVGVSLREER